MTEFNITNSKIEQLNDKGNNYKLANKSGNNVVADKGNAVQAAGNENAINVNQPKSFWSQAWEKIKAAWKWLLG